MMGLVESGRRHGASPSRRRRLRALAKALLCVDGQLLRHDRVLHACMEDKRELVDNFTCREDQLVVHGRLVVKSVDLCRASRRARPSFLLRVMDRCV